MGPTEYEWDFIWMTLVVFIPSVFALGLLFFPRGKEEAMRWWSLIGTALTLGVSLGMFINFRYDTTESHGYNTPEAREWATLPKRAMEADSTPRSDPNKSHDWVSRYPWIPNFHIDYYLGADGISMALVLLTTALCFLAMIASWKIDKFVRGYCILFLVLETGMLGTFLALDFFLFYIFWEVMLLPMYFLIGVWGGPRREYAAIKFFLYTLLGSVFILIALLAFYFTNVRDFVPVQRLEAEAAKQENPAFDAAKQDIDKAQGDYNAADATYGEAQRALETEKTNLAKAEKAAADAKTDWTTADDKVKALADKPAKDREEAQKQAVDARAAKDKADREADEARAARDKAQAPFDLAALQRAWAKALLTRARLAEDKALTALPVVVNTFDLILLQRVGKAASQYLKGEPAQASFVSGIEKVRDEAPKEVEQAKANLAAARQSLDRAKTAGNAETVKTAEEGVKAAEETAAVAESNVKPAEEVAAAARTGLNERLSTQAFFTPGFQYTMFVFLFIGFAIKVPVFPFHTWLPDAHVEAPTPISMILAGVLLKLGAYGIIRIAYPICPWAAEMLAFWVALFGVINIVYGAFAAMAQTDFKKLVAYSSVSHMGYVILGIAVWSSVPNTRSWSMGLNGAVFQMIAHGITSAGMFFLVGVIYDRAHHRNLDNFRGLYEPMPLYGGVSAVIFFAAMGLPGMCGFVGEFMVVLSAWNFAPGGHWGVGVTFSVLAALTVVLTAAYILWTIQRVFMGQNPAYKNFKDMDLREVVAAAPLVVGAVLFGVAPFLILSWMEPSVTGLINALASFK